MLLLRRSFNPPGAAFARQHGGARVYTGSGGHPAGEGNAFQRFITRMTKRHGMLSDPAVYPLLVIVSTGLTCATGFMIYYSLSSPDVRLNKRERNRLMREIEEQNRNVARFDDPFGKAT